MEKYIKYIDCDGVIIDTEKGIFDQYHILKESNSSLKRGEYLEQLNWEEWLRQAEVINNSLTILRENDPCDVAVLTKVHSLLEGLAKVKYFRENKIKNNIILVPEGLQKSDIVNSKNNLLVDNLLKNLDDWNDKQGISGFFNKNGDNFDTYRELHTINEHYPLITSLEQIFSPEIEDYCKKIYMKNNH
jgi:hypothetical protein